MDGGWVIILKFNIYSQFCIVHENLWTMEGFEKLWKNISKNYFALQFLESYSIMIVQAECNSF